MARERGNFTKGQKRELAINMPDRADKQKSSNITKFYLNEIQDVQGVNVIPSSHAASHTMESLVNFHLIL